jgi:tryptophan-rich sensory protein
LQIDEKFVDIRSQFVYGCIYLLFEAYPVVFTKGHNLNAGVSGLMFLPLPIGGILAVITVCKLHPYASTFL